MADILAMGDHAPMTQGVLIFEFGFARTKQILFDKIVKSNDQNTLDCLRALTVTREKMVNCLKTSTPASYGDLIPIIESYLPQLMGLVVSIEQNHEIKLKEPIVYKWSSCFEDGKGKGKEYHSTTYMFEVVMVFVLYAVAHINRAGALLFRPDDQFESISNSAAADLRKAAGIFEYISTKELPRFMKMPKDIPSEIDRTAMKSLELLCLSWAQAVTVKKGLLCLKSSASLLSGLSYHCWQSVESSRQDWKNIAPDSYKHLDSSFKAYLKTWIAIMKASTYRYMADAAYSAKKYGEADGAAKALASQLGVIRVPNEKSVNGYMRNALKAMLDDFEHIHRKYSGENSMIHYQKTVGEKELLLPSAKKVTNPDGYVPPRPAFEGLQ